MKKENTTEEKITVNDKKPVVKEQPHAKGQDEKGLKKEDLPDASNESTGKTGSGQRQDSN